MTSPQFRLSTIVLDTPGPRALAAFYQQLLGWPVEADEETWVKLSGPGGVGISFQYEPAYRRPTWPSTVEHQQMQVHLDIEVDDLDAAGARAVELGATPASYQPQEHVRVYFDLDGHVFCLWTRD